MTASTPALVTPPAAEKAASPRPEAARGRPHRRRIGRERINWPVTIILAICSLTVLVPLYVTVSMSLKTTRQSVQSNAFSLPWPLSGSGFVEAWKLTDFPRSFTVSILIAAVAVTATIFLSVFASYAISRNWNRRLFRWAFYYILAAMFMPFPVIALPQVKFTGLAHLDNPIGVAVLHAMLQLAFSVMLFTAYLRTIPAELEESAEIDGASNWQIVRRIILPLLAPMSATVGIFAFLASWNDYMMPMLITSNPTLQTLPVIQQMFQTQFSNNYNISFASYLMAMAPSVIVYVFSQRWVMSGLTQGAVKD